MSNPRYSVVLPVLNGGETLAITLTHLFSIDYSDFEVVVSDNLSNDNTIEILESINDPRLKVFRPNKRLGWSENLKFAYSKAVGEWQFHIGDDDLILPSKFKILDKIIQLNSNIDCIFTRSYRYHWSNYPEKTLANKIDGASFSSEYIEFTLEARKEYIRGKIISGSQDLIVQKNLINFCIDKYGFYVSNQHGEAFSGRAALFNSKKTILLDLPLGIMGRHQKSIGTQHLRPKSHYLKKAETDIAFSDPDDFQYIPFKYKGYISWTFDALLLFANVENAFRSISVNEWSTWMLLIKRDLHYLKNIGQIKIENIEHFMENSIKDNPKLSNIYSSINNEKNLAYINANKIWTDFQKISYLYVSKSITTVPNINVKEWNIDNISDLAYEIENRLPIHYKWTKYPPYLISSNGNSLLKKNIDSIRYFHNETNQDIFKNEKSKRLEDVNHYKTKYIEFSNNLSHYNYNKGNRCNPPFKLPFQCGTDLNSVKSKNKLIIDPRKIKLLQSIINYKNIYKDKKSIVIANGPSQNMLDENSLKEFIDDGNHVYRLNHFTTEFSKKQNITHYVCADYKFFSTNDLNHKTQINRDKIFIFLQTNRIPIFLPTIVALDSRLKGKKILPNTELIYFDFDYVDDGGWEPHLPHRYWSNTLLHSLAINRFLGYKKVYVIGNDTSYPQCIRVAPDNQLAILESHANQSTSLSQGYPLSSSMYQYMALLSFWYWSYGYICDERFVNLDPLSLVDSLDKVTSNDIEGWSFLTSEAKKLCSDVIGKYQTKRKNIV